MKRVCAALALAVALGSASARGEPPGSPAEYSEALAAANTSLAQAQQRCARAPRAERGACDKRAGAAWQKSMAKAEARRRAPPEVLDSMQNLALSSQISN